MKCGLPADMVGGILKKPSLLWMETGFARLTYLLEVLAGMTTATFG
jgi:hypothetical protein